MLRLSLMATNTDEHIDFALDKMERVGQKLRVI